MAITNSRHAETLFRTDRFWSTSWQHAWQNQQYVRLFLQVVAICEGEALRQAEEQGVAMRERFEHTSSHASVIPTQMKSKFVKRLICWECLIKRVEWLFRRIAT